ncbi:MAG: dihydrodipicolinate reductase [Hoeflea sp.]|uniref:dihydrodipicolinate reductase C-terminal domain-containing protein n=1 Tax=Hoeflea sp. TaxID=1940281 RepID=UPI001DFDA0F6|nr:dihydrodipicolinate reductase C-terminal domain-containing protein [Hoeflea sp.]MBU4531939.1 dihydrodipicolinate reductase [Alphaproteobacteria bacterium]MBU4546361.1 dihydrodipicolinate reductase [Alphaproteobacteria bacterium]MBU4549490.1 dihydrodipicolinate reductase [Alphaproteobacteria bacterium]MBV1722665.1 dihydrodipicolinate reductase [Hoeflea sp.]MBV1782603.1 dihydrodipicolinate reductase [Hoeflea sp.]
MRIGIMGASGRVGTKLVETIIASPGLELAAALVSAASRLNGSSVAGGGIEYRAADAAINSHCDVIIDFSKPDASLALQESIGGKAIPMVIGTTGFSADEEARLLGYSKYRPMLVSANFAHGFEAFRLAVLGFARQMPAAEPTVMETYHTRKKSDPSGTSHLLADQLCEARSTVMGFAAQRPSISVHREGETVGINAVRFDMGSAELVMTYQVHTLAAYAEGAIAAAQWLISEPRAPGRYSLADSLNDND